MQKLTVACVQQRMRLPATIEDYRTDLQRFMRAAQNKHARLVVFPELAGALLTLPMLAGVRTNLLKRADQGRRGNSGWWQRISGAAAEQAASVLRADLRPAIGALLEVEANRVWEQYRTLFGDLAREYDVTIVAPSAYLPDPFDGVIRNLAAVFSPSGELLGAQSKVILHAEDEDIAQAGSAWDVIQTDVGRIGLMLGGDVLYPEVGRLLAYQGAEMLICQGSSTDAALYNKIRSGMLARMQDNQLFGLVSFLVGHNELSRRRRADFVGKSAIFAPQELTPKFSGVLVEMGNQRSEGVLTAEWDFPALKELWESSDTPVRKQLPLEQINRVLTNFYERLQQGEAKQLTTDSAPAALAESSSAAASAHRTLDDLPVFASITSRWPLESYHEPDEVADDWTELVAGEDELDADPKRRPIRLEDETDEMEALSDDRPVDDRPADDGA